MAIQRQKATTATTPNTTATPATNETAPEVVHAGDAAPTPTTTTSATAPAAVQDASQSSTTRRRGAPTGPRGPQLSWGLVVGGEVLQKTLVEVAREVSASHGGYATLANLVEALKSHSTFTDNVTADGVTLADLVTTMNVRNQWAAMRDKFIIQFSRKPVTEGGLGFDIPSIGVDESPKDWKKAAQARFTDAQWAQMEDAIARPKPEGLNFPKLVVRRGRRAQSLDIDDI